MNKGIIVIDKPEGWTSHDVVAKLRGLLKIRRIGHTGTLDPMATGVLPICVGRATKLSEELTDGIKTYRVRFRLGTETDTEDITGTITAQAEVNSSEQEVRDVLKRFVGDCMQIPPMYSALKRNGKRLYELARAGIEVERQARPVVIYSIEDVMIRLPEVGMTVTCSKGTYIRSLCRDIGRVLGCGAVMCELRRTRVGRFTLQDALRLETVERLLSEGISPLIPITEVLKDLPVVTGCPDARILLHNGNAVDCSMVTGEVPQDGRCFVYTDYGLPVGLYRAEGNRLKPDIILFDRDEVKNETDY